MSNPRQPGDGYGYLRRNGPKALRGIRRAHERRVQVPTTPPKTSRGST